MWACSDYILKLNLPSQFQLGLRDLQDFCMESCPCKILRKVRQRENVFSSSKCTRERRIGLDHTCQFSPLNLIQQEVTLSLVVKETLRTEGGLYFTVLKNFLTGIKNNSNNNNFLSFFNISIFGIK